MPVFRCTDGTADIEITADTAENAAQSYVTDGDWGDRRETRYIRVYVSEVTIDEDGDEALSNRESHLIPVQPAEPSCSDSEHDWEQDDDGVRGHGGGVIVVETCSHCGCKQVTDTWAQDPATGVQGLRSVRYELAE